MKHRKYTGKTDSETKFKTCSHSELLLGLHLNVVGVLTSTFQAKCSLNDDVQVAQQIASEFSKMFTM